VIPPPNGGGSTDGGGGSTDGGGDADAAASPPATACNPDEKLDMSQIFVSTAGTATTGCSETLPCASIQAGIAAAAAQGKTTVYVDQGVYPEQLTLSAGIAIRGARSRTDGWAPICGDARLTATKVHPPTGVDRAVIAQDLGGAASLEALDVQYATVAQPGQSMYGVFATGATTTLSLVDVTMVVPAGGAGTNGAAGTAGVAGGASDCGHGVSNPAAAATPATPASNASIVTYDASGANPATGGVGVIGGEGHSTSAPPGSSQCSDNLVGCKPDPSEGVPCAGNDTTSCVGGGTGCGGTAGGVGGGGGTGGSSIALYAFGAIVTTTRGALQPGAGGNGGSGGAGGAAGGATGGFESASVCTGCAGTGAACGCSGHQTITGQNSLGSTAGAAGPTGAGAAGGDSWAFYANASNVAYDPATLFALQPAALAGSGSPAGLPGNTGIHN
jgi:hypothetical protein